MIRGRQPRAARRPRTARRSLAALAACFALACAACAPPGGDRGAGGRDAAEAIRIPLPSDIASLDLPRGSDTTTITIRQLVSDPLVTFDPDLYLVPAAAESWSWDEGKTRLTFVLREGIAWHDGRPVTADDVIHTWRVETDPERGEPGRAAGFNLVRDVVARDARTVDVLYERPFAPALSAWAGAPLVPAHLPPDADPPVGCGPYVFERWESGERIVLRPNDAHPDVGPGTHGIVFDIVPDYTTRLAGLRSGDLHVAPILPATWRDLADDESFRAGFDVLEYRMLFYWYIAWRSDGSVPQLDDPRVRRALTLAIDRRSYFERLGGGDLVAVTTFHPATWAYDDTLASWPFAPALANALLDDAGWRDVDGDGVRERDGVPLRIPLLFSAGNAESEKIAVFTQDSLRAIGVDLELEPVEFAVLASRLERRDFAAVMSGTRLDPDPDPYYLWHSSQAEAGMNYPGLRDPEIDAWIDAARETLDRGERARIYARIQAKLHELEPMTVFFYPTSRLAITRRLAGVDVGALGPLNGRPGPMRWRLRPAPGDAAR